MLRDIENGVVNTLEEAAEAFRAIHEDYSSYEWTWASSVLQQRLGKSIECVVAEDIIDLVTRWKSVVVDLDRMLCADAEKEFAAPAQIGFGLDGDNASRMADFREVRGTFDENSFVREIEGHIALKTAIGEELIGRLEKIHLLAQQKNADLQEKPDYHLLREPEQS